jgi:outer membrane biosynthesis protein TonB
MPRMRAPNIVAVSALLLLVPACGTKRSAPQPAAPQTPAPPAFDAQPAPPATATAPLAAPPASPPPAAAAPVCAVAPVAVEAEGEAMRAVLRGQVGSIQRCYEKALQRDPNLAGTLEITVALDARGAVGSVKVGGTLGSAEVDTCIEAAVRPLCFPPPHNGVAQLMYPLTLGTKR